ncbi:MAG: S-adenosyl-L-methionine-dependent tRNA 4-demethylwyosine synthase [Promethearchaeota archaeon]|nr:MAG: S-adenosyl-L-methionine-dependent tRNA 4-demethylwyosine synthase [Candidatus Lokiarchaeota archaeon]
MKNRYIKDNTITNEFVETYTKSTYRIIGDHKHTAIKPCHWLEQKLMTGRSNRNCYKEVFGVESHRCLQNTPSLPFCNHQCVFCWRDIEQGSIGSEFLVEPDNPEDLVEEMFRHQQDIIKNHLPLKRYLDNYEIMIDLVYYMLLHDGLHSIDSLATHIHVSKNKITRALNLLKNQGFITPIGTDMKHYELNYEIKNSLETKDEAELLIKRELTSPDDIMRAHSEALYPNHAAISLDGEPLLYPRISELIHEFKKRNMTTFVVTNGTLPQRIEKLSPLPSQLYITLPAPNEKVYKKTCRPMIKNGWENIMESINLVDSLSTRTLIRLTAVQNLNIDGYLDEYISLIEKANPNFFEIKGFTLQAKALDINKRLKSDQPVQDFFPDYQNLKQLAIEFEKKSGFPIIYTNETSRDILFAVDWNKNKDPIIKKP